MAEDAPGHTVHLRALRLRRTATGEAYPFTVPAVRHLGTLAFPTPVTFFVGENGTGKSTLLEATALAAGVITVGGEDAAADPTLAPVRALAARLALTWRRRTHRGFFLRAEDFFNFASRTGRLARELRDLAAAYPGEDAGSRRARGLLLGQGAAVERRYGDLHARSHGEAFLQVFQARFVPGGLYLLDEPDTALSPLRQLALLALLKDMVAQEAQFLIATHSPLLLACPDATIYRFDAEGIAAIPYDEADNVVLLRHFLADPEAFVRRL